MTFVTPFQAMAKPSRRESPRLSGEPLLAVVPNIGVVIDGDRLFMDLKAVEGLSKYARLWPGRVRCICREGEKAWITYGRWYTRDELTFEIVVLARNAGAEDLARHAQDAALLTAGADLHSDLGVVEAMGEIPVVMIIEYTLRTRLQINRVSNASVLKRFRTFLWLLLTERKRRKVLAGAAGIQANGWPAYSAYGRMSPSPLLYFDTRLRAEDLIDNQTAREKAASVQTARPLRLAFSGRLERMKGAEHLVRLARMLAEEGCGFTLDVFGDGSLRMTLEKEVQDYGLTPFVKVHGPVSFGDVLVPTLRTSVDLFVCCHPQGDPSCTYLETLGCGVPIVGYLNEAWEGLLGNGAAGVGVKVGDDKAMVREIARLDRDRADIARLIIEAAAFSSGKSFEDEYAKRVDHLLAIITEDAEPDHDGQQRWRALR